MLFPEEATQSILSSIIPWSLMMNQRYESLFHEYCLGVASGVIQPKMVKPPWRCVLVINMI